MRKHPKRLEDNRTRCGCGRVNEERMPTRQSTHADRGLLPWFDSPAHPQQHLKDRSSGSARPRNWLSMDYRVQPSNIVSVARPTGEEGYLGSSEQRNGRQSDACFTKAARPARYGGSEGQRVASDSASLSLRTAQTLWIARIATNLLSQHYYGSASKASSDGVDPPILAAALTGIAILPKGGINVFQ